MVLCTVQYLLWLCDFLLAVVVCNMHICVRLKARLRLNIGFT